MFPAPRLCPAPSVSKPSHVGRPHTVACREDRPANGCRNDRERRRRKDRKTIGRVKYRTSVSTHLLLDSSWVAGTNFQEIDLRLIGCWTCFGHHPPTQLGLCFQVSSTITCRAFCSCRRRPASSSSDTEPRWVGACMSPASRPHGFASSSRCRCARCCCSQLWGSSSSRSQSSSEADGLVRGRLQFGSGCFQIKCSGGGCAAFTHFNRLRAIGSLHCG